MSLEVSIKKKYKGFDLDVEFSTAGEQLGILGASGCGKSMTLKCIAGIETPDSGKIIVNGQTMFDSVKKINISPQKRKAGYLFQDYALFPHMTIEDNISVGLEYIKEGKRKKVLDLVDRFQLNGLEKRYPAQLSGGQQQRVALARILAYDPNVLLLDEPFSALDSYLKERLQKDLFDTLKGYSGDTLIVSHSRDELYQLCQHLIVMDNGRLLLKGDTKGIFKDPKILQVAKLTGCKNFSRAKPLSNNEIEAIDWGIKFKTSMTVMPDIDYVGIRAHDFKALDKSDKDKCINSFPIKIYSMLEDPFEWNIIFKKECEEDTKLAEIWWKCKKGGFPEKLPEYLTVEPEKLLLLRS